MKTILAADMHLKPGVCTNQNDKLKLFLEGCYGAGRLVLLGDTFNCWYEKNGKYVGDYTEIIQIFSDAVKSGLEVFFICGNRDFALSKGKVTPFGSNYSGFQIPSGNSYSALSEIGVFIEGWHCDFEQDGVSYHCAHGDMYCTDNVWHQLLRYLIMGNPARLISLLVPRSLVHSIFTVLKAYSRNARTNLHNIHENLLIKDEALVPIIDSGVDHIICGHLHQYMTRDIVGHQRAGRLTVLPCWAGGGYGVLDKTGIEIKNISCS